MIEAKLRGEKRPSKNPVQEMDYFFFNAPPRENSKHFMTLNEKLCLKFHP